MKTVIVIPVRYASSRFPGKPLVSIGGSPLIRQIWERARESRLAERLIVATDDERIREAVASFGADVIMTQGEFRTGTDRLAWVAEQIVADVYLNLQGDELIQDSQILDDLIAQFKAAQPLMMGTLKRAASSPDEGKNPNVVKVVTDREGYALYFSRSPIPFHRNPDAAPKSDRSDRSDVSGAPFYKHLGIYIYRRDLLQQFTRLPTGSLEEHEKLEQLRALENGIRIKVWETSQDSLRIDAPEDVKAAERFLTNAGPGRVPRGVVK
ncbi:MAG TPA: 3-deoxy-manno-octulosonate cytidylyltransferase [Nitrospiria bacterium]|nr:3-deoxy-manno-octulosonate cytidylyltransferase [Nitrospiria bacterium]